jgi:hypothetical protein
LKIHGSTLKERKRPLAYILGEAEVPEDVGHAFWVDIVEEAGYIEQEERSRMVGGPCGLNPVDQSRDGVYHAVSWSRAELGHGKEIMCLDVVIYPFGDNLFQDLAHALHQRYRAVCLWGTVIQLVRLVEDDDGGVLLGVGAGIQAQVEQFG